MIIEGRAPTPNASRYLQQVCKHWGHRFSSVFNPRRGTVDFGDGSAVDLIAHDDELEMLIRCEPAAAETLKRIVEEHVSRFAHKEGALVYSWQDLPSS